VKQVEILLVEDNPGDIRLTQEALQESKISNHLNVVKDGVSAMEYLHDPQTIKPDLILLDLNLPRKDGREVLAEIKNTPDLKRIPVVILTTSDADQDLIKAYDNHANCYIKKPVDFKKFVEVVQMIENFWFSIVYLPNADKNKT